MLILFYAQPNAFLLLSFNLSRLDLRYSLPLAVIRVLEGRPRESLEMESHLSGKSRENAREEVARG